MAAHHLNILALLLLLLLACCCDGAYFDTTITRVLLDRGLTKRESEAVQHRHRRRTKQNLGIEELEDALTQLDRLSLLPGQVAHLLRSHPLPELQAVDPARHRWCSYKTHVWCSCTGGGGSDSGEDADSGEDGGARLSLLDMPPSEPLPSVLSLDCEFKPLRCAIVDGDGHVRLDCLVTRPLAGTSTPPMPGILKCDAPLLRRVELQELQELLLRCVAAGTILVAHTPQADLNALGLSEELDGQLVDIAQMGPQTKAAVGLQSVSLKRMAAEHLGVEIQAGTTGGGSPGSRRHCAREDAQVTMRLYHRLKEGLPDP